MIYAKPYRDFLDDLRTLLRSGVPIREALSTLDGPRPLWRTRLARDVRRRIEDGDTLGEALAALPGRVPPEDAALLEAGERAGKVDAVLGRLVVRFDTRRELQKEVLRALAWPLVLAVAAVVLLPLYLLVLGREPLYLAIQTAFFVPFAIIACAFFVGLPGLRRGSRARGILEALVLAIPGFGTWIRERAMARTFGLLGLLVEAGGSLEDSLRLAAGAATLDAIRRGLLEAPAALRSGKKLHEALREARGLAVQASWSVRIQAAEAAGAVDRIFLELEGELERKGVDRVRLLARVVPVLLILAVGAVVLNAALSVIGRIGGVF